MEGEIDDELITQEDCWAVIAAYFTDKSLVSQQIDSFNEFVDNTMQELVDESCKQLFFFFSLGGANPNLASPGERNWN